MNKNFRSSKNLKQIPLHSNNEQKDESLVLKLKIRGLEQQIQLLKKTNLNIYIPISQKQVATKQKQNKDEIIKKLRIHLLKQQQQNQSLKTSLKRLQKQKEVMKITYQNEQQKLRSQLSLFKQQIKQLQQENQLLQEKYNQEKQNKQLIEKQLIQLKVEIRFMKQDLQMYKNKYQDVNKRFNELKGLVLQVQFNSKIYKANRSKITAIETDQLNSLKSCIFQLQRQIQQLLWKLANPKKQQKITLNIRTDNVAEQIVRLKKNIDMQLGFKGDQSVIKSFLDKYAATNQRFKQLIDGCKATDFGNKLQKLNERK